MEFETKMGSHAHMKSQTIVEEKIDFKYGLRENRRKTWRAEDLEMPTSVEEQKQMICKQCGKGFKSMKALCGHMACHSTKDRIFVDDESVSETDESGLKRPKRTANKRYGKAKLSSDLKNDSSVSEIDFDQEEVAMCLIMLSKDYRDLVGVGSNQESSDSVALETKSSPIYGKLGQKRSHEYASESVEFEKSGKGKQICDDYESENDDSTDQYFETYDFGKQKSSRLKVSDIESGKKFRKVTSMEDGSDSEITKFVSKGKKKLKAKEMVSEKKLKSKKKTKVHECPYCNRVFKSGQAMGGHKRTHFLGSGNINNPIAPVFEAETSEVKDMIDLNLPAPEEEEEQSEYSHW